MTNMASSPSAGLLTYGRALIPQRPNPEFPGSLQACALARDNPVLGGALLLVVGLGVLSTDIYIFISVLKTYCKTPTAS